MVKWENSALRRMNMKGKEKIAENMGHLKYINYGTAAGLLIADMLALHYGSTSLLPGDWLPLQLFQWSSPKYKDLNNVNLCLKYCL